MTRQLLPRATVTIQCDECGLTIGELGINTYQLASEISRLRREHAIQQHGWSK
jgi:hypothetical protein